MQLERMFRNNNTKKLIFFIRKELEQHQKLQIPKKLKFQKFSYFSTGPPTKPVAAIWFFHVRFLSFYLNFTFI